MNEQINTIPPFSRKTAYQADRKDFIFVLTTIICAFFLVDAVFWGWLHGGFTVAFLLSFITDSIYLYKKENKTGLYPIVCAVLAVALSPVFIITSNTPVRLLSAVAMALLSCVWFCALSGKKIPTGDTGLITLWLRCCTNTFRDLAPSLQSIIRAKGEKKKQILRALAGVLCALPILAIVIPLLISSDAAFEGLTSGLFNNIGARFGQFVLTVIVAPFLFACVFSIRNRKSFPDKSKSPKGADSIFWSVLLGLLSICYVAYLFSQLAYFFSAFSGILPQDYAFSYAEYARRGFFELCWIAGINLVILIFMLLFSKKNNDKLPIILQILGTFLGVFTLLLIATSFSKMWLYILNFSLTTQRVGATAFLVFMTVVFIVAIVRIYTNKVRVFQTALITSSLVLLVLGLGNINNMVAAYNYNDYVQMNQDTIDCLYLSEFPEGIPYLQKLMKLDSAKAEAEEAMQQSVFMVYDVYDYMQTEAGEQAVYKPIDSCKIGMSFNLPYYRAEKIVNAYIQSHPEFDANEVLYDEGYEEEVTEEFEPESYTEVN